MMNKQKNMPSIETQKRMHAFFMKTTAPRIVARIEREQREKEAAEKEGKAFNNNDSLESKQIEE